MRVSSLVALLSVLGAVEAHGSHGDMRRSRLEARQANRGPLCPPPAPTPVCTSPNKPKGCASATPCPASSAPAVTTSCSGNGRKQECTTITQQAVPTPSADPPAPSSEPPAPSSEAPAPSSEAPAASSSEAPASSEPPVPTSADAPASSAPAASEAAASSSAPATPTADANTPAAQPTPTVIAPVGGATVDNKILIFARTQYDADGAAHGLIAYGIPYDVVLVPQESITIPPLTSSATHSLYSGIITMGALSYDYGGGNWASAFSADQWTTLHNYQVMYGARMVRINEFPGPNFGATALGGCCNTGVEQFISFSDDSDFPSAGVKVGAELSSKGLWHYPAGITDPATTKVVAEFGNNSDFTSKSAAAVINSYPDGREQFVWFSSWAPQWSATSALLQHSHIHWMTRGLFLGKRKTHLNVQIDDLGLTSDMYYPSGALFRVRPADLDGHVAWQNDLNSRLSAGSNVRLEFGHNGNGDILTITDANLGHGVCVPYESVDYDGDAQTPLEFMKPLGSGVDFWPPMWTTYPWTKECALLDDLTAWYQTPANRDAFFHVSHTFTHLEMNNATYNDAAHEIQFNQAWFAQTGISNGAFASHGLIPPAITGLHNGDVIRAWMKNGITHVVGDNTRPLLRSPDSPYHPLISTVEGNGHAGLVIIPRWATSVYYNCDTWECDVREWKAISAGYGDYSDLLENAKSVNVPYLLALKADPYMFHQANMRLIDMPVITVGSQTRKMSMVMGWVETVAQELARITNWPIVSLGHDQFAQYFLDRMTVDKCQPSVSFTHNAAGTAITHLIVSAADLNCAAPIPVTIPTGSTSGGSVVSDKVGNEPPIQWVTLSGSPVTLALNPPVAI